MQRVVSQGQRVASRIAPSPAVLHATSGTTSQHQQPGHPEGNGPHSPTYLAATEDADDWDFVHDPVSSSEVAEALNDLATVTGLSSSQHTRARSEGNWSATSTDSSETNVNDLFAAAEYHNYHTAREQINDIVANVLNDPVAGPAICNALSRDHAFRDIVNKYAPSTALPAPAQVLTLPGPIGWPMHRQSDSNQNPLDAALRKVVTAVVDAACHLGNSVRRLPEDINILLSGIISRINADNNTADAGAPFSRYTNNSVQNEDFNKRWEAAFKRVLTTVAVAVVARRVVFKSLV